MLDHAARPSAAPLAGEPVPPAGDLAARVWMVDDSKLELARATSMLKGAYDVETFSDGPSMLERLGNGAAPEVMLLDGQMPGLSGLDLIRFLREQYDEVTLPILLYTATGERSDFGEALAAGANDYLTKPCEQAELRARLRTLVRCHRQAKEVGRQMRAGREREQWLRTTLSSIGEGVIATDMDGRILFMNAVAEGLTGVVQRDALAKPFAEVCRVVPGVLVAAGASPSSVIARQDGSSIAVEMVTAPIGGVDASLTGMVYVLRDVTERRRFDDARRARSDFEEKLIGIVSHDLRNPLHAIMLGASSLLSHDETDARTRKSLMRIQRGAERATRLVSDVLDFTQARLGSGIPMHREATNTHELAAQVVEEVLAGHPDHEVVLEATGAGDVSWDAQRIAQVLANLLGNAIKYGAAAPVTLRTRDEGALGIVIEVHNVGDVIPPETLATMFEPMKRGAESTDQSTRSIGLGLYIVKHIVDAHGGAIHVSSTESAGTTFIIRLPRA